MINKRFVVVLLVPLAMLLYCLVTPSYAQEARPPQAGIDPPDFERTGQAGFQFLHLPTTARNAALGGIKSGLTDNDVSAVFNNPANLVDVRSIDVVFSNISYIADIKYNAVALAKNFGSIGVFGVQLTYLDIGEMVETENVFDEGLGITERSGDLGTISANDLLFGVSYARAISDRLSIGGNFSFIQEKLADTKVENINMDFGIFYKTGFRSLRLAMSARNFGPDKRYTGFTELYGLPQSVRMPIDFRLGIGYDFFEGEAEVEQQLTGYLEGVHPNDGPERVHAALEYKLLNILSVRGGYRFNYDEQGLTAGGGLTFSFSEVEGRFDYAYADYGRLEATHLFTLGFAFGD